MRQKTLAMLIMGFALLAPALAQAQTKIENANAKSLQELLDRVRDGRVTDNENFKKREADFRKNRNRQRALLKSAQANIAREEARSERLEKTFSENELKLAELEALLNERLGVFGELFGIVRQVAGETKATLEESLISGELKGRAEPLGVLAKSKGLPAMDQLEYLWFALQQEMTAQGEIKTFTGTVVNPDGTTREADIFRVGPFTAQSEVRFIRYAGAERFAELGRQPAARYRARANDYADAETGEAVAVIVDPSRGAILNLLLQLPTLLERINQGGLVGYIIIVFGIFGVALALERIVRLSAVARRVRRELAAGDPSGTTTPLGRVFDVYRANQAVDVETLELKLDEAVMREIPQLERSLALLKLLAAVAPLMGLLGTVTGMILTFQAITLFGTGDPKLMAGGISQALMTTVLGLVVAIPILLLHAVAATRSREVVQILEGQAAGLIAQHAEQQKT